MIRTFRLARFRSKPLVYPLFGVVQVLGLFWVARVAGSWEPCGVGVRGEELHDSIEDAFN